MYRPLDCIALRTVRYSDRNSILTAYTRQAGRLSFLVPAGTGRAAARLRALLMPMGRFECVADIRPGRDIHSIRDVKAVVLPPVADPLLFDFIDDALVRLGDSRRGHALQGTALLNYHVCFLLRLTRFLGIEPDWPTYQPGSVLDFADGIFRRFPPAHRNYLPPGESEAASRLGRMTFRNLGLYRLTRFERNTILDRILLYYQTHYPSVGEPPSLAILRMMAD